MKRSFSQVFVLSVLDFCSTALVLYLRPPHVSVSLLCISHQFLICNYWKLVLNSFHISSVFHLSGFHHLFICFKIVYERAYIEYAYASIVVANGTAGAGAVVATIAVNILFSGFEILHSLHQARLRLSQWRRFRYGRRVYTYSFPVIYSCWRDANWHKQTTIVARRTDKHQIVFELKACTSHVLKHQMSKVDRKWTMMQTQMHRITKERWWKWSKMNTHKRNDTFG